MASKNQHIQRSCCPIACGLDVLGDHWTMLIVRDMLIMNKHEYKEFMESDEGISSNILSDRLAKLQEHGLIDSVPHPENQRRKLYYLTSPGKDLIYVLTAMAGWAYKHHGESLQFPASVNPAKEDSKEDFVRQTFARLSEWEQQYGIPATTAG